MFGFIAFCVFCFFFEDLVRVLVGCINGSRN